MLCRWIEHRSKIVKHPFLPIHSQRYLINKKYNKNGKAIYYMEVLEGLDFSRSTSPKIHTNIDEFTFVFYSLDKSDQIIILSYIDPFDEFPNRKSWLDYLRYFNIKDCDRRLIIAMVNLQNEADKRYISSGRDENEDIWTWNAIAKYIKRSVPTAIRMAKEEDLPVTMVGGIAYSIKSKLNEYLKNRIDLCPYKKIKGKKGVPK